MKENDDTVLLDWAEKHVFLVEISVISQNDLHVRGKSVREALQLAKMNHEDDTRKKNGT